MQFLDIFFLQAEGGEGGGGYGMLLMFGAIIVVFYFFMIRPQQKKAKQEQQFRNTLEKGDKVTTIGGIHGKIVSVTDTTAMVEIDNGVKVKMEKAALKPLADPADQKKR